MKKIILFVISQIFFIFSILALPVSAQTSAYQTVQVNILPISEIEVDGSTTLVIDTAIAGEEPQTVTNTGSSTYRYSTNLTSRRITGHLESPLPANTTLEIQLQTPSGTSGPRVSLSTSPQYLVPTAFGRGYNPSRIITYWFSVTVSAGEITPAILRNVVLTLTN